ncbi:MAG: arsenite methyltransferase [Candidatus Aminicenantes bacterium]|nr:arsenite methyltransferase [Candidatus Aminicenantes bacterium]
MKSKQIKKHVRKRYSRFAKENTGCCSSCGPCGSDAGEQTKAIGYSAEEIEQIPQESVKGLGCGNPTALADLNEGETILDLGAGAGIDVFLAANKVGPKGLVIGVDMTEDMVEKSKQTADKYGYKNVEFRLGEIENLPVEDGTVDVIISNCVINLSPDKPRTFQEAYRVLKPGGRILISDLVTEGELPDEIRRDFDAWAECIAGAMEKNAYKKTIEQAGFQDVRIVSQNTFHEPGLAENLKGKITSVQIKAWK